MEQRFSMNVVFSGTNVRLEVKKDFRNILKQAGFDLRPKRQITAIFDTENQEIRLEWPKIKSRVASLPLTTRRRKIL
jgi:hypothetical protein